MLSTYDSWLLPPESKIPELEDEGRERILLDILWSGFRQFFAVATIPDHTWRTWMADEILSDGVIFEALIAQHREKIEEAWAEENGHSKGDC